jgi:monoamine oxidase
MTDASHATGSSGRLDFAIVGGGVSGLYTAWRLLVDARERGAAPPSIAVFESGARTGGRLLTWLPAGPGGGLRAELGGMRFFSQQELVWNLLGQLGFGEQDIVKFWVSGPNLRLLLRGVSTPLDTADPTARYDVPAGEKGQQAGDLLAATIKDVLQTPDNGRVLDKYLGGNLPQDREQWDTIKPYLTWRGRPLWDVGFWNLLAGIRSAETYQYLCDAFGYYSLAANWNSAEAMQSVFLDFTTNPDYMTLTEGYSALPDALARAVREAGGEIRLETRLEGFEAGDAGSSVLHLAGPDGDYDVAADHLVLGLPRRSLELLAPSAEFDLEGDAALKRLVASVTPYPAFKLYLFYAERWWERWGIQHGRSVSDLPIRQTYYFAPDPPPDGGSSAPAFGLLMASYDDARAVDYWQGLVPPEDEWEQGRAELHQAVGELTADVRDGALAEPPPRLHKATDEMLRQARSQIALLHDVPEDDVPKAVVGGFADWGFDPFGGGWNFWAPQVDVRDAMERIKLPLGASRRVYVVGEAYSGAQGWVEGALTATEVVLETHLGLKRPGWLPADYYLGW